MEDDDERMKRAFFPMQPEDPDRTGGEIVHVAQACGAEDQGEQRGNGRQ